MYNIIHTTKPEMSKLPGGWEPKTNMLLDFEVGKNYFAPFKYVKVINNCFTENDCDKLIKLMHKSPNFESVSIQGRKDVVDDRIGSIRTTMWSEHLAEQMRLKFIPTISDMLCDEFTPTDWWQGDKTRSEWQFEGVSPMLRFMKYGKDGQHFAHYDAGFIYPDTNYRTLLSFVLYLTTNEDGCTRFIQDTQDDISIWNRDHKDWIRPATEQEVLFKSRPIKGNVLVFPHRMCHDVAQFTGDERMIIRGDILFKAK